MKEKNENTFQHKDTSSLKEITFKPYQFGDKDAIILPVAEMLDLRKTGLTFSPE